MNPEQWLSLKWNGGSTMSDRWLNQSKIIHLEKNIINNDSSLNTKEKISMLRNSMIFHLFLRIGVNYIYEYISKFRETPDTLHTNKAAEMADISSIL